MILNWWCYPPCNQFNSPPIPAISTDKIWVHRSSDQASKDGLQGKLCKLPWAIPWVLPLCVWWQCCSKCARETLGVSVLQPYHAHTSKPFDLEFKGTITQKVHHLKHRQLPDHWPIGAVASPWTWISSKNLGCNHYETVEIFNSNLNRIFMTLITKQDPHSDAESRNLFVLELLIIFRPICFENIIISFSQFFSFQASVKVAFFASPLLKTREMANSFTYIPVPNWWMIVRWFSPYQLSGPSSSWYIIMIIGWTFRWSMRKKLFQQSVFHIIILVAKLRLLRHWDKCRLRKTYKDWIESFAVVRSRQSGERFYLSMVWGIL